VLLADLSIFDFLFFLFEFKFFKRNFIVLLIAGGAAMMMMLADAGFGFRFRSVRLDLIRFELIFE